MRRIVLAGLAVAMTMIVVGAVIPFLGSDTEWAMEKCVAGAAEGIKLAGVGWSWRPYGTKCRLTTTDGDTVEAVVRLWRGQVDWKSVTGDRR